MICKHHGELGRFDMNSNQKEYIVGILNSLLNALADALLDALFNSSEHTQMMVKDIEFYKFWLISCKMINDVVAINPGEHTHILESSDRKRNQYTSCCDRSTN